MFSGRRTNLIKALAQVPEDELRLAEIGTFDGKRATALMRAWYASKFSRTAKYLGFDLFEDMTKEKSTAEFSKSTLPPSKQQVANTISTITPDFMLIAGDTTKTVGHALKGLAREEWPEAMRGFYPNMVIIDGGHSIPTIESDFNAVLPLLFAYPKMQVILDDYYENRDDVGCKTLVTQMNANPPVSPCGKYRLRMELLDPVDVVPKTELRIRMVKAHADPI